VPLTAQVERARVSQIVFPLERPFASGIHHITHIRNVVVEFGSGEHVGSGFTFAFKESHADAVYELALDMARSVIGRPTSEVRAVWAALWTGANFVGHEGPPVMAMSCIDMALWDLHARVSGLPLHTLLGAGANDWPVYASGGSLGLDVNELCAEALEAQRNHFAGYKFRVGSPAVRDDRIRVAAVREAVGEDFVLMIDANQAWSLREAQVASRQLAEFDLQWLEEPIVADDIEGLAALRRSTEIPLAAGETVYGVAGLAELVRADAVDYLQPDLMRCGGLTPFLDVVALATDRRVSVMPHLYSEHSAQLVGLLPPGATIEYLPGWFDHLYGAPPFRDGTLRPAAAPGFSRDLHPDNLRELCTQSTEVKW
jgi:mandelate racemase